MNLSQILKRQLSARQRRNPNYSLRAFARSLNLDVDGYEYENLNADQTSQLSNWFDFAILELISMKSEGWSVSSIAAVLNLKTEAVKTSLQKLKQLKLIEKSPNGKWRDRTDGTSTTVSPQTNETKKDIQRQFLEMAIGAIHYERDATTVTMVIDSSRLEPAKQMIKKFRRELGEFLAAGPNPDRVYSLSVSLYPVSKPIREN